MQSPPQPKSKVPRAAVERAVNALLKWKSGKSAGENPKIMPSDEFMYLVVTLIKIPDKSCVNAHNIPLPHPLYTPQNSETCLFVADNTSNLSKSKVEEEQLPVNQVLKLSKLKKNYKAFEQKRKLCDSFDLFLAEKRIIPLLPNVIGKEFYKKKKIPVPVELTRGNWGEQIEKVCSSTMLYLSTGSCSVVKVGRASMGRREIVENVLAAVEGVANVVPKKWKNVRSFHLKFSESLALPVYQMVSESGLKIGGGVAQEKVDEVVKNVVKAKKVNDETTMKKGRIHEVRYMDEVTVGEDESGSECKGEEVVDEGEEEAGKKRKKGDGQKRLEKGDVGLQNAKESSGKKVKKRKVLI
ncbi:hypothetical protein vseg_008194 [Gypsophila vaccaria]